jgi:hypothetical protein
MRFASATYLEGEGMLEVTFENGDHFVLALESMLPWLTGAPPGPRALVPRAVTPMAWGKMRIGETGDVLEVPADGTVVEIPWDRIRAVADPAFGAHLSEHTSAPGGLGCGFVPFGERLGCRQQPPPTRLVYRRKSSATWRRGRSNPTSI